MAVSDNKKRDLNKTMVLGHSEANAPTSSSGGAALKGRVKGILRKRRKAKTKEMIKSLHSKIMDRLRGTASR